MDDYKVNERGIIVSPGKFEGCRKNVPALWDLALEGFSDDEFSSGYGFIKTHEDEGNTFVTLTEDENGFIWDKYFDTVAEYQAAIKTEQECDDPDDTELASIGA